MASFRHHGAIAVNLEAIVVSVAVAFAIRSLFLQPFKIPTGSMQPTLYGIHHVPLETEEIPSSRLVRIFDYLNYSRRYFNVVAFVNVGLVNFPCQCDEYFKGDDKMLAIVMRGFSEREGS